MVRQIVVDSSDTIATWVQKVNQMSDSHMGDLDDLNSIFDSDVGRDILDQDSNFVAALNHIGWLGPTVGNILFGQDSAPGSRQLGQNLNFRPRIVADSANFDRLNIGGLLNNDAAIAVFDPGREGDSEGLHSLYNFDFNADSARITKLQVRDSNNLDAVNPSNISIDRVLIGGTGKISRLFADESSTINIINARIITTPDTTLADSVLVTNRLTVTNFIMESGGDAGFVSDSVYINNLVYNWDSSALGDSANFNVVSAINFGPIHHLRINDVLTVDSISINRLIMDDLIIDSAETFILGDSLGAGIFAAYSLGESN